MTSTYLRMELKRIVKSIMGLEPLFLVIINPTRRDLWNGHREGGGLMMPPCKNLFRNHFDPFLFQMFYFIFVIQRFKFKSNYNRIK